MEKIDSDSYACTLLFQFRKNNSEKKKMLCEERIFKVFATSEEDAYQKSLEIGKREELEFDYGTYIEYYEFVGILELVELSIENDDEIWHSYKNLYTPMKRKNKIIPMKDKLGAFARLKRFEKE